MIKTKGRMLIKVSSIIFLIYGAAALLAVVLSLLSPEAMAQYGLDVRLSSPLPALAVTFAVLTPLLYLAAGLFGMLRADRPKTAKPCLWLGIPIFLLTAADILYALLTGAAMDAAILSGYALNVLLPVLYLIGTWKNLHAE